VDRLALAVLEPSRQGHASIAKSYPHKKKAHQTSDPSYMLKKRICVRPSRPATEVCLPLIEAILYNQTRHEAYASWRGGLAMVAGH